jgi:uncharacterized protein (TIGR00297 family)
MAGGISLAAFRARSLSPSGGVASTFAGTIAIAAGWSWGILLLAFFLSATQLSRLGARRKAESMKTIVAKTGTRDARQVLANGGIFAAAAAAYLFSPSPIWLAVGAGAIAASAADTWATEVGTLLGGEPRSIISSERVPIGTSGGVTFTGWVAAVGGAVFIASGAWLAGWPVPIHAVVTGGIAGATADSLAGATIQERRWCDACQALTERQVHGCGTATTNVGGIGGFDNDAVNLLCSCVGALVTLVMS